MERHSMLIGNTVLLLTHGPILQLQPLFRTLLFILSELSLEGKYMLFQVLIVQTLVIHSTLSDMSTMQLQVSLLMRQYLHVIV